MPTLNQIPRGTQRSEVASVAAPIGGWNARDSLGAMDPLDAVQLTNWWSGTSAVLLRSGFTNHATGIPAQVESLFAYVSTSAGTLFAAAGTEIYDVTTAGAVGAASLTGLTNARWRHANFTTTGGSYLVAVNGADKQIIWNGSAWHRDGEGAPYNITNLDTADATTVTVFKNYLWYTAGTLKAWYLPINAIGGAATALDMTSLCQDGGYLVTGMTWTLDAGYGADDYLAFITSKGEVLVWRLTDPSTPTGIALIGVYSIGAPIGNYCAMKYGGDLLIITQDGVVPMSASLQSSRLDPRVSITNKIQFAMSDAITNYGSNFGWQLLNVPKYNQLYLNVPVMEGSQQQQYVQNNITKAWCNFTGWAANCWELFNNEPFFGGNGVVCQAWNGTDDNGVDIQAFAIQSFQPYGPPAEKQCKMMRAHLLTDGTATIFGNVNTDYDLSDNSAELSAVTVAYGLWDTGVWDTAFWGSGLVSSAQWQGTTGIGYVFAPILKVATQGFQVQWAATDLILEAGGAL